MSNDQIPLRDDFLRRLRNIRQQTSGDYRAPHKPLLLLIAFAGVALGEERLIEYSAQDDRLSKLLIEFGPPVKKTVKPFEPFKRLPKDKLWELVNVPDQSTAAIEKITGGYLKNRNAKGGLLEKDYQLLRQDREFLSRCIIQILESNFPLSYHSEILQAVGIPNIGLDTIELQGSSTKKHPSVVHTRDPKFRNAILKIYERACSICRSTVRLNDTLMGIEAAHIKWHAYGGPDIESNGLALCSFHHKAFDRGVIGLNNIGDGYQVEVSSELNGYGPAIDWLRKFENKKRFYIK